MSPKFVVLSIVLALFTGCARAKIVSWEGKKFTVCGNLVAKQDTFDKVAQDRCYGGTYRAIAGGSYATGDADVHYGNGSATVIQQRRNCVTYECD